MESILQTLVFISIFNFTGLFMLVCLAIWAWKTVKNATPYPDDFTDDEITREFHTRMFNNDNN